MTRRIRSLTSFLLVVCASAARAQDRLVLLSPHWEGIRYEFAEAFRALHKRETGRDVEFEWLDVGGGGSDQLRFIRSEFKTKPDGIGVDLLFGGGVDPYLTLKAEGLLESYRVPDGILREVAPQIGGLPLYDTKDFTWYAPTMAGFGIIYNKPALKRLRLPEPKTWEDLARPEFFSWVGSADPTKSGSAHMAYEIILQAYGWERGWQIITAMGANVRSFTASAGQTPRDAASGEVACGLCIDFYAWRQANESGRDMIGFVYPAGLTAINGDGVAILRGASNRGLARRFIDFLLSENGQKLFMLKRGEPDGPQRYDLGKFSVRPSLYAKVKGRSSLEVDPFEWKSDFVYDAARGAARTAVVNDLVATMIIDPKARLADAWKRAIREGKAESELPRLAAMPVTEEDAQTLVEPGRWKDAEFRNKTLSEWSAFARAKYGDEPASSRLLRNLPGLVALAAGVAMILGVRRRRNSRKVG